MFGEQRKSPDDFETAKDARRALQEAAAAYPEVREAVANPSAYSARRSRAPRRQASCSSAKCCVRLCQPRVGP